jgi:mannosidase alpha-like ER degradation enhancer 1
VRSELEDKSPSFVTAETLLYLYLTFDESNPFLTDDGNTVWSTEGKPLAVDRRADAPPRRRRSFPLEAGTCPAYDARATDRHQHDLKLSVQHRIDFEHARYLAGYEPEDEAAEVREGRWAEWGWCQAPVHEVSRRSKPQPVTEQ